MTDDAGRRVVASHAIARRAFRLAGFFGAVAVLWALWVLLRGGSWWGPVHAFLAGTVLCAIAGASQMFTVTWSAAPAPPATSTTAQRLALAGGTGCVLVGVTAGLRALTWVGGALLVASLALLAWSIRRTISRSLLRRFDLSSRFYLLAFACGAVGVTLGAVLGTGAAGAGFWRVRLVHSHLNLVGLVGFTIVGRCPPSFPPSPTIGRSADGGQGGVVARRGVGGGMASGVAGRRSRRHGNDAGGRGGPGDGGWNRTEVVGQGRTASVRPGDGGSGVVGGVGLGRRTPSPGVFLPPPSCSHLGGGGGGSARCSSGRRISGAGPGRAASGAEVPPHVPPPGDPLAAANLAAVAALAGAEPVVALLVALWVADFALRPPASAPFRPDPCGALVPGGEGSLSRGRVTFASRRWKGIPR